MAVVAFREILPRTFQHRFGEAPAAERRYQLTLNSTATPSQQCIAAIGIYHGDLHPEYPFLRMFDAQLQENTPDAYHVEITYRYEVPQQENLDPNPLARPDVWSFSTSGVAVPALTYFDGDQRKALVNTANDVIEGAMTEESEVRATIAGNRAQFPLGIAAAVTNCVNSDEYLGGLKYTWKCQGIGAQQQVEVVNDIEIRYWSITVELVYRQSGWPLLLPNVGWNYLEGGEKKRCWVKDEDGVQVASASPVALELNGNIRPTGAPDILTRRVHKAVAFEPYFGTPPF